MGLFDSYQFSPQGQGGGLLDILRMFQQGGGVDPERIGASGGNMPMPQPMGLPSSPMGQPSPLDTAQWPHGPMGAPQQQPAQNAMAQAQMPQQQMFGGDSYTDRIGAGGSLIGSLFGAPPQIQAARQMQNMTVNALRARGVPEADIALALSNPEVMKALMPRLYPEKKPHNVGNTVGAWDANSGKFDPQYTEPQYKSVSQGDTLYQTGGVGQPPRAVVTTPPKPREMSVEDIRKLQDEGAKFNNLTGFVKEFKDEYAGAMYGLGDTRNLMGRTLPDWAVDPKVQQASIYWQKYDRYKNVVRNELYGSALTPSEQKAFEQADINNTMNPKVIRENLKTQKDIVETALKRRASAMVSENFRPETIAKTYGMDVNDLQSFIAGTGGGWTSIGDVRIRAKQ
jgi:hypothetical protein